MRSADEKTTYHQSNQSSIRYGIFHCTRKRLPGGARPPLRFSLTWRSPHLPLSLLSNICRRTSAPSPHQRAATLTGTHLTKANWQCSALTWPVCSPHAPMRRVLSVSRGHSPSLPPPRPLAGAPSPALRAPSPACAPPSSLCAGPSCRHLAPRPCLC